MDVIQNLDYHLEQKFNEKFLKIYIFITTKYFPSKNNDRTIANKYVMEQMYIIDIKIYTNVVCNLKISYERYAQAAVFFKKKNNVHQFYSILIHI